MGKGCPFPPNVAIRRPPMVVVKKSRKPKGM